MLNKQHPILTAKTVSSKVMQTGDASTDTDIAKTSLAVSSIHTFSKALVPGNEDKACNDSQSIFEQLKEYLPQTSAYIIETFRDIQTETFLGAPPCAFEAHLWLQIETAANAQTRIDQFQEKTRTTYRALHMA